MRSRDKCLPLDTWNTSGLQGKTFLVLNFLHLTHPEIILKEFTLVQNQERQDQFHKQEGQEPFFTRDDKQNRGTIPMPTLAGRPSTMSSFFTVEIPQSSMVGQQRQQISELQFDKFTDPQTFLMSEDKIQKIK